MLRNNKIFHTMALTVLMVFSCLLAEAFETYYVRPDGGSMRQCSGRTNAPYSGSGYLKECAYSHPSFVLPVSKNGSNFRGGDTVIIYPGEYKMGLGAPNQIDQTVCAPSAAWACTMEPIPSGPDAAHPTKVLGAGWDEGCAHPPVLYGVQRIGAVINLQGSKHVEVQCLDLTDRDPCTAGQVPARCNRNEFPFGEHADRGIVATDSTDVLLKNLNIHGFSSDGIHAGRIKDWRIEDTRIANNSMAGWNGDVGADNSANAGFIHFKNVTIEYNGCGETYPGREPYQCFSQDLGGYGDGLGTHATGGHWIFDNVDISHNTSDGLDLLYHNQKGKITIKHSRFEGNAGNQVKVAAPTYIENSILIGNCAYFEDNPLAYGVNHCRAMGNTLSVGFRPGMKVALLNSTVTSNGDVVLEVGGGSCEAKEKLIVRNSIITGGEDYHSQGEDRSVLFYRTDVPEDANGSCDGVELDLDYSLVYGARNAEWHCDKSNVLCTDPRFVGPLSGDQYGVQLMTNSPVIDRGLVIPGVSTKDYSGYERGAQWDMGAYEFQK